MRRSIRRRKRPHPRHVRQACSAIRGGVYDHWRRAYFRNFRSPRKSHPDRLRAKIPPVSQRSRHLERDSPRRTQSGDLQGSWGGVLAQIPRSKDDLPAKPFNKKYLSSFDVFLEPLMLRSLLKLDSQILNDLGQPWFLT